MSQFILEHIREISAAGPGFDLRGRGLCQRGGGGRESLKELKVEVKLILKRVLVVFILNLCLKLIASEACDEIIEKN